MSAQWLAALDAAVPFLRCPVCTDVLRREGAVLRCPLRHSFDLARQGYVNLKPTKSKSTGDEPAMLDARARFLERGHFAPLRERVAELAAEATPAHTPGCVVDVGAGTGWYLAGVLDRLPGRVGVALDASSAALRRAASAHDRAAAVGADVWSRLPLGDDVAALLLVVFAPRNAEEFSRVLHRSGKLLVVTPTSEHLAEARDALGLLDVEEDKEARLAQSLGGRFTPEHQEVVAFGMALTREDAVVLAAMGPSARHMSEEELRGRVAAVTEPWSVTASVRLAVYRLGA